MPTLPEVLAKLSFLTTTPAVVGLVITASLIVVVRDWRFSLAALSVQYVLAGLLLTRLIQPQVAVIKVLIGALVCVILYLTARLVSESSESPTLEWEDGDFPPNVGGDREEAAEDGRSRRLASPTSKTRAETSLPDFAFRLLAVLFVGLAVYTLSKRYPLPEVPPDISFACYWLASLGLLVLMLTDEPLKAGMGLLTLITGFEPFYSMLERSLSVVGFLGIANFLIALAMAYIAASGAELTAEERQR
jgi:uncharacterized MnhB-related membrane protein